MNINQESYADRSQFLRECPLFAGLDAGQLDEVAQLLEPGNYAPGDAVFTQAGAGDCLYIVHHGRLEITTRQPDGAMTVSSASAGGTVGELALLTGARRSASVHVAEAAELWRFTSDSFAGLKKRHPETAAQITHNIVQKQYRALLDTTLHISKLLQHVDGPIMQDLLDLLEITLLPSAGILVREGAESDSLYIVISGRLRVVTYTEAGQEAILIELGRGEAVGEAGLITGERRSATVYAVRDTVLARLSKAAFNQLLAKHPQAMMQQFAATVINRLQGQVKGTVGPGKRLANLAFVPLTPDVPLKSLVTLLARQLGHLGATLHLDSAALAQALRQEGIAQTSTDDPANIRIVSWLAEQETRYRYIVYEADASCSLWTQRCLRQADHVVLVANAGASPAPTAIERDIARIHTDSNPDTLNLVLLHPPNAGRPAGTHQWLAARQVGHHYHVKQDQPADIARLARLLTGQGIGLVLSGGGARGFAHIGTLRALSEAGIPIDLIGGSSMGGLMACQFAMGWDFDTIMARNRAALKHKFDYTFPFTSLMAGGEMTEIVQEMFADTALEDMWLPCFCTTTNLSTAKLMIHTQGPAWKYARATTSIPGILPPVMENGEMLIDGGLLDNLPIHAMRRRSDAGIVFASDVSLPDRPAGRFAASYESRLSGWQVLWRRLNPLARSMSVPSMGEIMMQIAVLSNRRTSTESLDLADFYVRLPVDDYGMLDFGALRDIVAKGYQAAQAQVAALANNQQFQSLRASSRPVP